MRWRRALEIAVLAVAATGVAPALGQILLERYDDFNVVEIDPIRWRGYEYTIDGSDKPGARPVFAGYVDLPQFEEAGFFAPDNEEAFRGIVSGRAQLMLTSWRTCCFRSTVELGKGRNGLRMSHPELFDREPWIQAFQALVVVGAASVEDCHLSGERLLADNVVSAQLFGHFFNDGSSANAGDLTGDVFARIALELRRSGGGAARNVVRADIGRCRTTTCSRIDYHAGVTFTRAWTLGLPHTLEIAWRPASNAFVFTVAGGGGASESRTVGYTVSDAARPRSYAYDLRVETQPGFCVAPDGRAGSARVGINVQYDDVRIDSAAAAAMD